MARASLMPPLSIAWHVLAHAGRGRVVCTGMGADSTPVLVEEANKTVSIAKALCKRVLAGRLVHDLSDSEKWDVHLHFRPGDSRITGDVGLSMLAGLLALAMGRPLDEDTTAYWGVRGCMGSAGWVEA